MVALWDVIRDLGRRFRLGGGDSGAVALEVDLLPRCRIHNGEGFSNTPRRGDLRGGRLLQGKMRWGAVRERPWGNASSVWDAVHEHRLRRCVVEGIHRRVLVLVRRGLLVRRAASWREVHWHRRPVALVGYELARLHESGVRGRCRPRPGRVDRGPERVTRECIRWSSYRLGLLQLVTLTVGRFAGRVRPAVRPARTTVSGQHDVWRRRLS